MGVGGNTQGKKDELLFVQWCKNKQYHVLQLKFLEITILTGTMEKAKFFHIIWILDWREKAIYENSVISLMAYMCQG